MMQSIPENAADELIVLLDFQSNWSIDAETSLAFASAVLEVIRAEVGLQAKVELLSAGTGSKWFSFRFIDLAALVGVALAVETSVLTEGTLLNRTLAQADELARIAAFVIKSGKDEPKTIPRSDIAILARRDKNSGIVLDEGNDDNTDPIRDAIFEEPLRWLGRFENVEDGLKFVVGEKVKYVCRFKGEMNSGEIPMQTSVGLIAQRIFSDTHGRGQIVILLVSKMVNDWEQQWVYDTTAGDALTVRAGGYLRLLSGGEATFSTFGGPNFYTSSEPFEAGPYSAGQRLVADVRLVAHRDGRTGAHFHDIDDEEQFIERERGTFEAARRALADPLDELDG